MKVKRQLYDLRSIRQRLKMSQQEAADSVGVSLRTWQRNEKGAALEQVVEFVLSVGGEFIYPNHPFDLFEAKGWILSLDKIKIKQ